MLAPKYYKQDLENSVLGRIINHDITKVNVIGVWKKYFFLWGWVVLTLMRVIIASPFPVVILWKSSIQLILNIDSQI